ncbi:hypothetical protein KM043_006560 [Ampulex compressa]|nr:hypothetical protein KM043_006560 [Ampulex compressa]
MPKEIRFRIAGTALLPEEKSGEAGGEEERDRVRDRIEQDHDPPRLNLALSHVRVIPFHPADEDSPHLGRAHIAVPSTKYPASKEDRSGWKIGFATRAAVGV